MSTSYIPTKVYQVRPGLFVYLAPFTFRASLFLCFLHTAYLHVCVSGCVMLTRQTLSVVAARGRHCSIVLLFHCSLVPLFPCFVQPLISSRHFEVVLRTKKTARGAAASSAGEIYLRARSPGSLYNRLWILLLIVNVDHHEAESYGRSLARTCPCLIAAKSLLCEATICHRIDLGQLATGVDLENRPLTIGYFRKCGRDGQLVNRRSSYRLIQRHRYHC